MIVKTTVKNAINLIYRLDCEAYPEEMTSKEWYLDRYDGRETVYLYYVEDVPVAYMAIMDICKELADALCNGVLDGDFVVSNNMFKGGGEYFYIASCVVDHTFRNRGIFHELLKQVLADYENKRLYALTNSLTTEALLNEGFTLLQNNGHYNSVARLQKCDEL